MPLTAERLVRFHDCRSKLDLLLVFNVKMEQLIDTELTKGRLTCLKSWVLLYIVSIAIFCQILTRSGMCKQHSGVFIWYHSPDLAIPMRLYCHLFSCLSCLPDGKRLNTTHIIFHKNTFTIHHNQVRSLHF